MPFVCARVKLEVPTWQTLRPLNFFTYNRTDCFANSALLLMIWS
jgi:hypothetical protein